MNFYVYFFLLAELTALIAGTYYFKQIRNKFLLLYVYVVIGFLMESTLHFLYYVFHVRDNRILTHFYYPVEFLILALFYIPYLKPLIKKKWILIIISLYVIYSFINPIFVQNLGETSNLRALNAILLIFLSIAYFYRLLLETKENKIIAQPMFWINTAVLLYFSSILFYNVTLNLMISRFSNEFVKTFGIISGMFLIVFYLLIATGFYLEGRKSIVDKRASLG